MSTEEESTSRIDSHDMLIPTPDSPSIHTTELPNVNSPPCTPERGTSSSTSTSATTNEEEQNNNNHPSSSSPTLSPSSTSSGGERERTGASPSSNQPPSRRVKVYKLKDDAWVDLGTGTCRGILNHQQSPPGDMEEVGKKKEKVDPDQEGAWIVVKREKPTKPAPTLANDSTTKDANGANKEEEGGTHQDVSSSEEDDDEDDKNVILRTRVQPYPPGYSEDFDEEELLEGEDGQTLDVGGYQRQQDTLIVWTERPEGEGEEEMEMALSFATSTGCAEMWEFIKAARRFTAEQALLLSPSPSPSLSSPRSFPMHANFTPSTSLTTLPTPTLGSIPLVENTLRALSRTAVSRERTAVQIIKTQFIEKLVRVHQEAEDLESLEDLHAICRVMQNILLLNDNAIFELVLKDEMILGVAGILEYDPDFPTMKASYKSHLSSPNSFISLVPISSPTLLSKIHQTHRLHYLKDVILARILEDSTFSMLNSAIYFNEVEIVNEVVGEKELLSKVFDIFNDEEGGRSTSVKGKGKERERELGPKRTEIGPELPPDFERREEREDVQGDETRASKKPKLEDEGSSETRGGDQQLRKQQAIQFLTQLTQMAKNLQLPLRTSLYRTLVERGLLTALEKALRFANELEDVGLRAQVIAIWMSVVDLDAKDVRAYCLRQGKEKEKSEEEEEAKGGEVEVSSGKDREEEGKRQKKRLLEETMLGGLIETLKVEQDLGIKTHLAEALRVLLDAAGESGPLEAPPRLRAPEDPEAEKFLQYFYDHYILSLLQPLIDLPDRKSSDPPLDLVPAQTALLSHLCDLLCFFIAHHSFRSKYLILSSPQLAKSVSHLLRPRPRLTRHTHLRLAALRFFRACVARNDDFYNRFLIKHDLVRCVVETAEDERDKDNLLGSACLEFFEYVRGTNAKGLINHLVDRCGDQIRKLATTFKTFEGLVSRWAINNEPPPSSSANTASTSTAAASTKPDGSPASTGENGSNGTSGATSGAMQRQTSNPGWPAAGRMDVEEESYFNTDDDDDDDSKKPSEPSTSANDDETPTTSSHFASSRRKREPTSNPSLSSSLNDSKRVKLDDEVDEEEEAKNGGGGGGSLPRSQTWPQGSTGGKAGGLVDYMDEDEDETPSSSKKEDGSPAGGFIREGEEEIGVVSPTGNGSSPETKPNSAPLPLPGALKRKQEEEEEGEGLGGLLRSKNAKKETSPLAKPKATTVKPSNAGTALPTKPGEFKIAFGTSLSKAVASATPDAEKKGEEGEGTAKGGFGKFGTGTTTKQGSPSADKG